MKIKVTKEDIQNGVRKNPARCPIALEARRDLKVDRHSFCWAGRDCLGWWDDKNKRIHILKIKHEIKDFVQKYDEGWEVFPFSFEVSLAGTVR